MATGMVTSRWVRGVDSGGGTKTWVSHLKAMWARHLQLIPHLRLAE